MLRRSGCTARTRRACDPWPGKARPCQSAESGKSASNAVRPSGALSGQRGPRVHWRTCPRVSLGSSRPSFIGEASPEALPQARVHKSRHLGPVPPAPEPCSGTVRKPAAGPLVRWEGGRFVRSPSKPLKVFQTSGLACHIELLMERLVPVNRQPVDVPHGEPTARWRGEPARWEATAPVPRSTENAQTRRPRLETCRRGNQCMSKPFLPSMPFPVPTGSTVHDLHQLLDHLESRLSRHSSCRMSRIGRAITPNNSRVVQCARFLPRCFRGSAREGDVPIPRVTLAQERDIDLDFLLRCVAMRPACNAP